MVGFIIIITSACTKVIDVDLNESNPKLVIDGAVNFADSNVRYASVKLSWTGSYYSSNDFNVINGAELFLKSPDGISHALTNTNDGIYVSTDSIVGNSLDNFELSGIIDGKEISAISSLPNRVEIDSIGAYVLPFGPPNDGNFRTPVIFFTDLKNDKNYYRFRLLVNGESIEELFFQRDDGQDGELMIYPFFRVRVSPNDTITIQLLCIDKASFDYYKVLSQNIGGGGFSAAPGNPNTNIQGDAIGVFTAQNVSQKTIIVK